MVATTAQTVEGMEVPAVITRMEKGIITQVVSIDKAIGLKFEENTADRERSFQERKRDTTDRSQPTAANRTPAVEWNCMTALADIDLPERMRI